MTFVCAVDQLRVVLLDSVHRSSSTDGVCIVPRCRASQVKFVASALPAITRKDATIVTSDAAIKSPTSSTPAARDFSLAVPRYPLWHRQSPPFAVLRATFALAGPPARSAARSASAPAAPRHWSTGLLELRLGKFYRVRDRERPCEQACARSAADREAPDTVRALLGGHNHRDGRRGDALSDGVTRLPSPSGPRAGWELFEEELCNAEPADFLVRHAAAADGAPSGLRFVIARAYEQAGDYARARELYLRVVSEGEEVLAARAQAHVAHLDYYAGDFATGVVRAEAVVSSSPVAQSEADLYASVNRIALNDGHGALSRARLAELKSRAVRSRLLRRDLRFRVARQSIHVLIATGRYLEAASEAETAAAGARLLGDHRRVGYACYLRGFMRAARGDPGCVVHYAEADKHWDRRYAGLQRWLRYVWAIALRDLGDRAGVEIIRPDGGPALSWEEPLFALFRGERPAAPDIDSAPPDERPFRQVTCGLLALLDARVDQAIAHLAAATMEFDRCGLHHYRRGAALTLAAATKQKGSLAAAHDIVARELAEMESSSLERWPWWHLEVARSLRPVFVSVGASHGLVEGISAPRRSALSIGDTLRAQGLTERELEVVERWLANPDWSRARLAQELGCAETSVRAHLNSVRRKLGCLPHRGPDAIRLRVEEIASGRRHGLL